MKTITKRIDSFLNDITMYRLLLYGLGIILALAAGLSYAHILSTSGTSVLLVTFVSVVACYGTNKLFSWLYNTPTNSESSLITALILACILYPTSDPERLVWVALASVFAIVSKFVLVYKRKHIFNPAALGAAAVSLLGLLSVSWWIGSPKMLPFVAILGVLIIRKIHRVKLVGVFLLTSLAMLVLISLVGGSSASTLIRNAVLSGPLLFFATIMLTEPATMPSLHYYQLLYGLLVGALYTAQLRFGLLSTSPHMVLLVGNIFAFVVNPVVRERLKLKQKIKISNQVYDYVFTPQKQFVFMPG